MPEKYARNAVKYPQKSFLGIIYSQRTFENAGTVVAQCPLNIKRNQVAKTMFIIFAQTLGKYVNEQALLKPIYKVLEKFGTITEEVQNDLVNELRKNTEAEVEYHRNQINSIRNEYEKEKDNGLLDAWLDTSITKKIYDKKHQKYADKVQLLEIQLSEHRETNYEYQTTVANVTSVARRAFLNYLLQNPTVKGKSYILQ